MNVSVQTGAVIKALGFGFFGVLVIVIKSRINIQFVLPESIYFKFYVGIIIYKRFYSFSLSVC